MVIQHTLTLPSFSRGVHIITPHIKKRIEGIQTGIANIFLLHTSASLAINENYDPDVRVDIETFLKDLIPDGYKLFSHTLEGEDDMPAHLKNIFIGSSVSIPIKDGNLYLGTWQGIYLLEHRNHFHKRELVITLIGE